MKCVKVIYQVCKKVYSNVDLIMKDLKVTNLKRIYKIYI
jgi:hypothetical protein